MSQLKSVLEITPPGLINSKGGEVFTSHGHKCPECHGKGYFHREVGKDRYESEPCPICKGSGFLMAKIVVGWIPEI